MEEPGRDADVDDESEDVVGYLDEGTCGKRRVNLQFFEGEGHDCAEHGGKHHDYEQRNRY